MNGLGGGMFPPIGWANPITPGSATVTCGDVAQAASYTTEGATPLPIGFQAPTSWSDRYSWVTDPTNIGEIWTCQAPGIYAFRASQNLTITNGLVTDGSGSNVIIPNTTFYADISQNLIAPAAQNNLVLRLPTYTPDVSGSVTFTALTIDGWPQLNVGMFELDTPAGFFSSTTIPGGVWTQSLWASSSDENEGISFYTEIQVVDADGFSNPITVFSNSSTPTIVASPIPIQVTTQLNVPTITLADLTKRIHILVYANFEAPLLGVGQTLTFFFGKDVPSNWLTTVPQLAGAPFIQDTVNVRMVLTSATTEFNQTFEQSMPVVLVPGETLTYSVSVAGQPVANTGDTLETFIASQTGHSIVTSGNTTFPAPVTALTWNLIAAGAYGNIVEEA